MIPAIDIVGGAIGVFSGLGGSYIGYATLKYAKKRNKKEDKDKETEQDTANAVALAEAITDISWIKQQLGKEPNGGNAMEQLLNHAKGQSQVLDTTNRLVTSMSATLQEHLGWHISSDRNKEAV